MKYKIISFDLFQTLVDVNKRIPDIWKEILGEYYSEDRAYEGAGSIISEFPSEYRKAISSGSFIDMGTLYHRCAEKAAKKLSFSADPAVVAQSLMYQHSMAPFYDDALSSIKEFSRDHTVIISSDSSHLMADRPIRLSGCSGAFISDDLSCYKADVKNLFFGHVLESMNADPSEIIHIGDSASDITGASACGITGCLLNRDSVECPSGIKPDYMINSLSELGSILY